ncbi:MSEP-CTERM sorting domain-containing protein [Haliscomenobacter sp.]|uniref:MSEP-CTERM sorting domain-containing protein n=1 Tax=Haliscomenobacter sp. TaxID=2717303 RepID=UPI003BA9E29B
MQNWRSPWWILVSGVFPVGALLALATQIFYIIAPQLDGESKTAWYILGISLSLLGLGQLGYYLFLHFNRAKSNLYYHIAVYILFFCWLLGYLLNGETLIPNDIPTWMLSDEARFYPIGFLMPNMAFSMYSIIAFLTNFEIDPKPLHNLFGAFSVALISYIGLNVMIISGIPERYFPHIAILGLFSMSTLFFFFLGRSIYIFGHRPWSAWSQWDVLIKGILGIAFPIWGLMLNNSQIGYLPEHVFGNFSSPWFYALAVVNGVLFTLPNYPHPLYRLVLFLLRSLFFPYILYFALVFLPFLPLAIPAILAIGTGFLMLTPVILLVLQSATWIKDLQFLQNHYPKFGMIMSAVLGACLLPSFLYFSAVQDRKALHQALDYVYAPDFDNPSTFKIADARLARVFAAIQQNKRRRSMDIGGNSTPYLSHFYNSMVLDNLTLSDRKLNKLEAIFLGKDLQFFPETIQRNSIPQIKTAQVESKWNEIDQSWTSTLHLELENPSRNLEEYRTLFSLPDGALIQDYYLYIGKEKVKGELAEKKTATWIYEQIRNNTRRDPGLLSYLDAKTLSLRVYPFQAKEVRKTGFTVIHKEAFQLTLDQNHELTFGELPRNQNLTAPIIIGNGQVAYIPMALCKTLPKVKLMPHYHFIVDCSAKSKKHINAQIADLENLIRERKLPKETLHFHLANRDVNTLTQNENWQAAIRNEAKVGGFFAERAFEKILYSYTDQPLKHYPVMVLVTENLPILPEFTPRMAHFVYNGLQYYHLGHKALEETDFWGNSAPSGAEPQAIDAVAYPNAQQPLAYLSTQQLVHLPKNQAASSLKKGSWESAALLQAEWRHLEAHPELGETTWQNLIKKSFNTGLLTPETAYLVLENESQRRLLRMKQKQVLQGKKAFDVGEEPVRMSEPGFWVLLGLMLLIVYWRKMRV